MTDPTPAWERRFRAPRVSLPEWAPDAPQRCVYLTDRTGAWQVHAWDRETGTHRQVTDRAAGTVDATISPDGDWLWWFDDTDGDEYGVWRRQPFAGGPDEDATGLAAAWSAGLALGPGGLAVVGRSDDAYGTQVHVLRPGASPDLVYEHREDAGVAALSRDGRYLALAHSEHGDSRHPAVRVLDLARGAAPALELWDGPGRGLEALGFSPVRGDGRLLLGHERRGRAELLLADVAAGWRRELAVDLPGELAGDWVPDGGGLVVCHDAQARRDLHVHDLEAGTTRPLGTPRGTVGGFAARPDGPVWFSWSSAEQPPRVLSTTGEVVLDAGTEPAPPSVPAQDVWADGPGGRVHALLLTPDGPGPHPVVVDLHGGPAHHDTDAFSAAAAAWVDHGLAVLQVNYRGSTGYGSAWRDALEAAVGLTELADVAAVHDALVSSGVVDPARSVLAGGSWGGFLTLLGLGTQPQRWAAGVAAVPVADYVAAYEDEMEALQAFDRALFGGSPAQVPDAYARSSPLTYVDRVTAPVLVLVGENDPRCPARQVDTYLAALAHRGHPFEVYRFDAGHGSLVVEERIRQARAEMGFVLRTLAMGPVQGS